ncbi:MAG: hypothetical protein JWR69_1284 [Pedosphaera sp.]|nr:hypothetical protein [Pedosphaera sp.]
MSALLETPTLVRGNGISRWLRGVRSSPRLAFALSTLSRILISLMSLLWTRLLLAAMGKPLNGLFLSYQSVAQLGGLGDLGMGGAVAIQTGQYLGQGKQEELRSFLSATRTVFLLLSLGVGGGFLLLSPWLPRWLGFQSVPGAEPLPLLFAVGALSVAMLMLSSYVNNLNYACSTLTWPVIPSFFILQCCLLAHWWLARHNSPLWLQYFPYVLSALVSLLLAWTYLRISFPNLAALLPLRFDFGLIVSLFEKSFWVYLCSLGNLIYIATDRLVIQAWFGPEQVPRYQYNYKVCELAVFVILNASYVALPKITQWLATPGAEARKRVHDSVRRLTQFQALLGCAAAFVYLAINDFFMAQWLGSDMQAPLLWQAAFALNLAVTTSGEAGIEVSTRCGGNGMRVAGSLVAATGLLNLGLSVLSARLGSIVGIGFATVIAQSLLSLGLGFYVCRHLKLPWVPWVLRTWFAPALAVCLAGAGRKLLPFNSPGNIFILVVGYTATLGAFAWLLGITPALIHEEWMKLRALFRRKVL